MGKHSILSKTTALQISVLISAVLLLFVPNQVGAVNYYTRVYGGDIFAGGGVKDTTGSCSAGLTPVVRGRINGNAPSNYSGSGVELAIFAVNAVTNFQALSQQNSLQPGVATYSNVGVGAGNFGGNFTNAHCNLNYYDAKPDVATMAAMPATAFSLASVAGTGGSYYADRGGSGTQVFSASTLADGKRAVFYVNGNVHITGSGMFGYANNRWADRDLIPSITIVATGNIYIAGSISEVHGILIAQSGAIHTCARNNGANPSLLSPTEDDAALSSALCGGKLTVYGAAMSKELHLLRHTGALTGATVAEPRTSANISEVFVYPPELFLTEGAGLPRPPGAVRVQSINALPPVF